MIVRGTCENVLLVNSKCIKCYVCVKVDMGVYKLKMLLLGQRLLKMHLKYSTHTRPGYYLKCAFFSNDLPGSVSEKPGQFVSYALRKALKL